MKCVLLYIIELLNFFFMTVFTLSLWNNATSIFRNAFMWCVSLGDTWCRLCIVSTMLLVIPWKIQIKKGLHVTLWNNKYFVCIVCDLSSPLVCYSFFVWNLLDWNRDIIRWKLITMGPCYKALEYNKTLLREGKFAGSSSLYPFFVSPA